MKGIKWSATKKNRWLTLFIALFSVIFMLSNASAATTFNDLDNVKWAEDEIYYLHENGIINGYGDGKFGPSDRITREQAALMLVNALYPNESATTSPNFRDLSETSFYYDAIALAAEKGLINGYTDDTFRPGNYISRAETAALIDSAYDIERGGLATSFSDVKAGVWSTESILDLASQKILNGYTDGSFKPNNKVTRAEFSVILTYAIEPDLRPSDEPASQDELEVHFIDVGQGDSTLIISPSGKTMLIDGGKRSAGDEVVSYLNQEGITSIDLLVATHPDADHIGGLIDVLEQFNVKRVLDSGKTHTTETYMDYLTLIDEKDIPFDIAEIGTSVNFDNDLKVLVLNGLNSSSDSNESSVVLKVTHGTVDFMLTGDASVENELTMIENFDVEAEILKVGHHGSDTSTSQAFVDEVDPEAAVLSYGENNYGHPHADVVNRLRHASAELYSTFESGDIVVTTNGQTFTVSVQPWDGNGNGGTPSPEPQPDPAPQPDPEPETQFPINVNTADYETLQLIKGVGPRIAQNIIDYRNANGPFQSIEELDNVSYIGPATIEEMRPYITLGE